MKRWAYPALAFVTGAAIMVYEFAAPYLFRAHFSQLIFVWANVIAVILGALSVGYAVGGRWADRTKTLTPLASVIAFAGVYGIGVAIWGPAFCRWLAGPEEVPQEIAANAFTTMSLAATVVLFGPPILALGMATPLFVQRASLHAPVGWASGAVFGVSTVGSVFGIYATTFWLQAWMGVRATIATAGITLLVLAAAIYVAQRRRVLGVACLAACAAAPFGWTPVWHLLPPEGSELVLAIESPYQLVRVVDRPPFTAEGELDRTSDKRVRWLAFDEGMGTYHSIRVEAGTRWTGAYYDAFAHLPEWAGYEGTLRVCILGNAAGTMSQLLHTHHDGVPMEIDGVEIDPAVTDAARRTMGLDAKAHPSLTLFHEDGRTFLKRRPGVQYDVIVLDAYSRQVSLPAALATKEFFELTKRRLRPGGLLLANLGALRPGSRLVEIMCNTIAAGFGSDVYRCPLEFQANVLLVASRGRPPPPPPEGTPLGIIDSFGKHVPDGFVLTDDYCPVEMLTARDLRLQ